MDAVTEFYATRVFGPDRAALLAAITPVTTAAVAARATARSKALKKKLAKIDVAETGLITELETSADPDDPAAQALRNRIRARFTELYAERTRLNADLAALQSAADEPVDDPTLLDELPMLGDIVSNAPPALVERLLALFDVRAVYNRDKHQLTVRATITDGTLQAVNGLLDDPRTDHNQASQPGPTRQDQVAHSAGPTGSPPPDGVSAGFAVLVEEGGADRVR
jgi:site-specific DNA recombinase